MVSYWESEAVKLSWKTHNRDRRSEMEFWCYEGNMNKCLLLVVARTEKSHPRYPCWSHVPKIIPSRVSYMKSDVWQKSMAKSFLLGDLHPSSCTKMFKKLWEASNYLDTTIQWVFGSSPITSAVSCDSTFCDPGRPMVRPPTYPIQAKEQVSD